MVTFYSEPTTPTVVALIVLLGIYLVSIVTYIRVKQKDKAKHLLVCFLSQIAVFMLLGNKTFPLYRNIVQIGNHSCIVISRMTHKNLEEVYLKYGESTLKEELNKEATKGGIHYDECIQRYIY